MNSRLESLEDTKKAPAIFHRIRERLSPR